MKIVRKETGQASKSSGHQSTIASEQREKMTIDIIVEDNAGSTGSCSSREKRFKSVMDIELEDSKKSQLSQTKWPRIPKVPQRLRGTNDFHKQFEPRVVSVGPYHHHKPELKTAEAPKCQMTKLFIQRSCQTIEVLYQKILNEISEVRNCYSETEIEQYYNDEDFAWMMLVDGCSLLHCIHCYTTHKLNELPFKHQNAAFVQQDLFLMENQLPFRILELLLMELESKDEEMLRIEEFICLTINVSTSKATVDTKEEKPSHLLDLLRRRLLGNPRERKRSVGIGLNCAQERSVGIGWNSIRNVKELNAAGIRFKPNKSGSLRDISFNSYFLFGRLQLPLITVNDWTKVTFLNLIAYEMCPEVPSDPGVTSYICFLKSLIDDSEDVKELRRQLVLRNLLGSDEQVATLFVEIATDLAADISDAYKEVKSDIEKHLDNIAVTLMTRWPIMAFLGAVLALFFSGLQTFFTVFPRRN